MGNAGLKQTIRLRKATGKDCRRVWRWRNEPQVRKASFNSKPIPFTIHKAWYSQKLRDTNTLILVGNTRQRPFGYVRIERKGREGGIHIVIKKASRNQGLGTLLLETACRYGFKHMRLEKMTARIKPDNRRSIYLFERVGFKPGLPVPDDAYVSMKLMRTR